MSHWLDWAYDWIHDGLPSYATIVREGQLNEIPTSDFIAYDVVTLDTSSLGSYRDGTLYADPWDETPPYTIGTFDRTYQQNCPLTLQVKSYALNGAAHLQLLGNFARSIRAIALFDTANVAYIGSGVVRNMKFLDDNQYRPCWMSEFDFMIAMNRTEALEAILEIHVTGTITGNNGDIHGGTDVVFA